MTSTLSVQDQLAQCAPRRPELAAALVQALQEAMRPGGPMANLTGREFQQAVTSTVAHAAHEYESAVWQLAAPSALTAPARTLNHVEVFAPSLLHGERATGGLTSLSDTSIKRWMQGLLHLCLYADVVWVPDPLDILVRDLTTHTYSPVILHEPVVSASLRSILTALKGLETLSPLFDKGILRYYPPIAMYYTYVREDITGEGMHMSRWDAHESFVIEGICYARHLGAAYTPLNPTELGTLEKASCEVAALLGTQDQRVLRMLPYMTLPYFKALSPATVANVRLNDESFEAFRAKFRVLLSDFTGSYSNPDFFRHLREFEDDRLKPAFETLAEEVSHSKSLRSALADSGVSLAAGAFGTALATTVLDEKAFLAGAVSGVATLMLKILRNQAEPSPSALTVYHLTSPNPATKPLWGLTKHAKIWQG